MMKDIIKRILKEGYYDPEKLYSRQYVVTATENAPSHIKKMVRELKPIKCLTPKGDPTICVKLPEFLHVYITGRY